MTTLNEMIAVMQAAAEGKEIEYRGTFDAAAKWRRTGSPSWNWLDYGYRVKPQPHEFTIAYREDTGQVIGVGGFPGGSMIQVCPSDVKVGMVKTMRVREVLDNE